MIGEIRKAITPFYDLSANRMRYKSRPVLLLARAAAGDYVALPISRVTRRENLHPVYDIKVDPKEYPKLGLAAVSYIRTHKQIVIHVGEITGLYGDLKGSYAELYLEVLAKRKQFSQEVTIQALSL